MRCAAQPAMREQAKSGVMRSAGIPIMEYTKPEYMSTFAHMSLFVPFYLQDDLRCQTLDRLQQIELRLIFGTFGKARREILANDGTRVGKRIDRVAHAIV